MEKVQDAPTIYDEAVCRLDLAAQHIQVDSEILERLRQPKAIL